MAASTVDKIVGREAELFELESFLERASIRPEAFVIEGEPGIGKTTLWGAALASAATHRLVSLVSRPGEFEAALPYLALTDLLESRLDDLLRGLSPSSAGALRRALVELGTGDAFDHRAVCNGLLEALRLLAAESPVLVAVDDAQWLDNASARALAFAARRLIDDPVSFLVTTRAPRTTSGVESAFAEERLQWMRIEPLDEEGVERLLRARLGATFRGPTLRALRRASGGNPLFVLELARALARDGATISEGDPLPVSATLRELVADRIADLPGDVQDGLLFVAAALRPTAGQLESALGPNGQDLSLLLRAVEAGVIEVDRGRVRFTHPLLGSVLYSDATLERIHAAHRRLADVVTDQDERARHLALATEFPDASIAATLDEAARRADNRGAPDAAAAFSQHALRLTPDDERRDVVRRTIQAADYLADAGATARAHELLAELLPTLEGGRRRARVLHRLARLGAYEEGFRDVAGKLGQALEEAEDDVPLRAAIERDLALTLAHSGDLRQAAPHARRALELARRLADRELLADAEATAASVEVMLGRGLPTDLQSRSDAFELTGDEDRVDRHPAMLLHTLTWGAICKWSDDFEGARRTFENLLARLTEREEEGLLVPVLFHLAELECWAGNLQAAERHARACMEATLRAGQPGTRALALYAVALVVAHLGPADAARSTAEEGLVLAEEAGDPRMTIRHLKTLGFLDLSLGDFAAAEQRLGRAHERATVVGYGEPGLFRLDGDQIESLVALGRLEKAEELTEQLAERGSRLERPSALAFAERSRGLLAAAGGELGAAENSLARAAAALERLPQPLEYGRAVLLLGSVKRRMRQKRRAREEFERALAIFEALPAPLWVERARVELGHIGGRAAAGWELTATERRVAELVADGLTNREVAFRLYVSEKTVEFHLRNTFRKLGVRSRTELARALAGKD